MLVHAAWRCAATLLALLSLTTSSAGAEEPRGNLNTLHRPEARSLPPSTLKEIYTGDPTKILIGLLLPAVQKVRVEDGGGDPTQILIGLSLPAVQKVRVLVPAPGQVGKAASSPPETAVQEGLERGTLMEEGVAPPPALGSPAGSAPDGASQAGPKGTQAPAGR